MEEKAKGPIVQGLGLVNLSQREQNGISVDPSMSTHCFFSPFPSLMDSLGRKCVLSQQRAYDCIVLMHSRQYEYRDIILVILFQVGQKI